MVEESVRDHFPKPVNGASGLAGEGQIQYAFGLMQGSGAAARLPKAVGAPGMMGGVIATPPTILGGRVVPCGMAPMGVVHEEHACVAGVPQLVLQCAQFAPAQCELGNAPFA